MSDSDRSEFVALVAVVCTVLVFVIGLAAGAHFGPRQALNQPVEQPHTAAAEYYQEQRGPAEGYWWPEVAARDTYAQWTMSILALAATALSVVGVVLLRRTFIETKRTADAAESSTRQAARAAVAAQEANGIARENSRVQSRAYVSINEAVAGFAEDGRLRVLITFKNSGQTPAYDSLVRKGIEIRSAEDVEGDTYGERKVDPQPTHIIGPGDGMRVRVSISLSPEESEMLKLGITRIIAYGILTYEDIFDQEYFTEFNLEVLDFGTDEMHVSPVGRMNGAN